MNAQRKCAYCVFKTLQGCWETAHATLISIAAGTSECCRLDFEYFFNILPSYLHQCFLPSLTFSLRNQALADAFTKHVWHQRDFSDPAPAGGDGSWQEVTLRPLLDVESLRKENCGKRDREVNRGSDGRGQDGGGEEQEEKWSEHSLQPRIGGGRLTVPLDVTFGA